MITFKQYISEQEMQSVYDIITRDCRPFLEHSQGAGFLLRGIKGLSDAEPHFALDSDGKEMLYSKKSVRQDRRPLDTTKRRSEIIDDWFNDKFGIRARSQCVFAGGNSMRSTDLKHYGTPCVIFPIGEMQYVWSPYVEDIYGDMNLMGEIIDHDDLVKQVNKWLDGKQYKNTGLHELLKSSKEIMVKCNSYYAFPLEYETQLKLALGFK